MCPQELLSCLHQLSERVKFNLSQLIINYCFWQFVLSSFLLGDVVSWELIILITYKKYLLHVTCKLPYLYQFSYCLSNCNHLIMFDSCQTYLKATS